MMLNDGNVILRATGIKEKIKGRKEEETEMTMVVAVVKIVSISSREKGSTSIRSFRFQDRLWLMSYIIRLRNRKSEPS